MKLSATPRVVCISDPGFGGRSYPYAFGCVPRLLEKICINVFNINSATATSESFRKDIEKSNPELIFGFIQNPNQVMKISGYLNEYHPVAAINWYLEDPNAVFGTEGNDFNMIEASGSFDMWFSQDSKMIPFWKTKAEEHIILIDDARCFVGKNGYPTIEQVKEYIIERRADWIFDVKDDIIRTHQNYEPR